MSKITIDREVLEQVIDALYPERDHMAQGQHYVRHVDAMTREGLHSKSRIAGELAARDIEIDRLRAAMAAIGAQQEPWCMNINGCKTKCEDCPDKAVPEQSQQEPVAIVGSNFQLLWCREHWAIGVGVGDKLYTSPPSREPLTVEQIKDCLDAADQMYCERDGDKEVFNARAIEAAHGIKDTPC